MIQIMEYLDSTDFTMTMLNIGVLCIFWYYVIGYVIFKYFLLLTVSFDALMFLIFMKSSLSTFTFIAFSAISKKSLPNSVMRCLTFVFFWEFYSLVLMFYSLIHFEVIFGWGKGLTSVFLWISSFFNTICWKECPSPHWMGLWPLVEIIWPLYQRAWDAMTKHHRLSV